MIAILKARSAQQEDITVNRLPKEFVEMKSPEKQEKNSKKSIHVPIGVFICALCIRLLYISQLKNTPIFSGLALDSTIYHNLGIMIANGHYTARDLIYFNPLYPFFIGFIYSLSGESQTSVLVAQAVLDALSCFLVYHIGLKTFNRRVALIASGVYTFYGIAIFYTGLLLAPSVVVFFSLLMVAFLLWSEERSKPMLYVIGGLLFGIIVLVRANLLLFILFLPLWFFVVLRSRIGVKKASFGFLFFLLGFFGALAPNSIRNYMSQASYSPFSVQGGINFYIGNNPKATGWFVRIRGISAMPVEQIETSIKMAEGTTGATLTPMDASRFYFAKGLTYVRSNPIAALGLFFQKLLLFWSAKEIPLNIDYQHSKQLVPLMRLPLFSFGIVGPMAILGILFLYKARDSKMLIILYPLSVMLSLMFFFVSARYRMPAIPFIIILSASAIDKIQDMVRRSSWRALVYSLAGALGLFIILNSNLALQRQGQFDGSFFNNLGATYFEMNLPAEAEAAYRKAITVDPNYALAHFNLGILLSRQSKFSAAAYEFRQTLRTDPNNARAHHCLGLALVEMGQYRRAIESLTRAVAIDPSFAEAYNDLGKVLAHLGRLEEAVEQYSNAIKAGHTPARFNLIGVQAKIEKAGHYNNLGVSYVRRGNFKDAVTNFQAAVSINPYSIHIQKNLIKTYQLLGEKRSISKSLDAVKRLDSALYKMLRNWVEKERIME